MIGLAIAGATQEQVEVCTGENQVRRKASLHRSPEPVVDISDRWKYKGRSKIQHTLTLEQTYERIFEPAIALS